MLFVLHGGMDARRVSDGHFDGFCSELGNCRYSGWSDIAARWSSGLVTCEDGLTGEKIATVLLDGNEKEVGDCVGVWCVGWWCFGFGWVEEEKREQEKKCRSPYIHQPVLLLHLEGMTLRRAEAVVAQHKQGLE